MAGNSVPKIFKTNGKEANGIMKNSKFLSLCFTVAGLFFVQAMRGDDLRVSGEFTNNGLNVVVSAPGGFTNRVEIYTCSNLLSGNWRTAAENLRPSGGSPAQWYTEVDDVGFFIAGNMDIDSDGDGLPDARELFVHKTNPVLADTDSDGLSDYEEIHYFGTNPLLGDTDDDGIPDALELNIVIFSPVADERFGDNTVTVQGEVVFNTNGACQIWVNSRLVEAETNGPVRAFFTNVLFSANGSNEVVVSAKGFLGTNVVENIVRVPVYVQHPPNISILSPLDDVVVYGRNVHVEILSDSTNQVVVGGANAIRDGFIHYAWVALEPGTNVLVAASSSAYGQVGSDSITVVCDVPPGTPWEPVPDQDMDGVLDENDPVPDNPGIRSNIYITEPVNGGTTWLEVE